MAYNIKKDETNTQLVEKFMTFGSPLNQVFLIEAVMNYSENLIKNQESFLKQENQLINHQAWLKAAKDFMACIEARNTTNQKKV